jgi:carbon monoxide dehydrogenase subunit G
VRQLTVEATCSSVAATLTVYVTATNATIGTLTGDGSGRFRGNLNFGTNPGNITVKSSGGGSATRSVIAK